MRTKPAVYFVRAAQVDLVASAAEQALADDGLSLLDEEEEATARATRTLHVAQVTDEWVALWDTMAAPAEGFPDGDPATSFALGLSAAADTDVLYLWGYGGLWGYFLCRCGIVTDRFCTDARILAAEAEIDDADVEVSYRGELARLRPFLRPGRSEEELAEALSSGDDALHAFLDLIGLPTAVALSDETLAPSERQLTLRLRFAPRP